MFGPPLSSRPGVARLAEDAAEPELAGQLRVGGSETSYWRTSPCSQLAK